MRAMSDKKIRDVVIIGGGPAGYTAALYAARAGLDALVIEKFSAGGQMTETMQIDNRRADLECRGHVGRACSDTEEAHAGYG